MTSARQPSSGRAARDARSEGGERDARGRQDEGAARAAATPTSGARPGSRAGSRPGSRGGARASGTRANDADIAGADAGSGGSSQRVAAWVIALLLCVTPLLIVSDTKEAFRLVQGLAGGWLGLASLLALSWLLHPAGAIDLRALWRQPAVRALVPLLLIAGAGGFFTSHPAHFRASFADFAIGAACVIGWSLALPASTLTRLLAWTLPPALLVAALGLDQFAGLFGTLDWLPIAQTTDRLQVTSTVGNPGDLAALLVLPILVALSRWRAVAPRMRLALGGAIALMLAAMAITATLAAGGAILAGAAVWLLFSAPAASGEGRRAWRPAVAAIALLALAGSAAMLVSPLRTRVTEKVAQLARGDINGLLTGRLDGWRAAIEMLREHPARGVGQGGYRAAFADTRLALTDRGVTFFREQTQVMLATPHNEALSVAAEQGLPGLAALAWAIWCVLQAARRLRGDRTGARALAWAGIAALGLLALFSFPLHVPAVAWPWLLFLAWLFRSAAERPFAPALSPASANAARTIETQPATVTEATS